MAYEHPCTPQAEPSTIPPAGACLPVRVFLFPLISCLATYPLQNVSNLLLPPARPPAGQNHFSPHHAGPSRSTRTNDNVVAPSVRASERASERGSGRFVHRHPFVPFLFSRIKGDLMGPRRHTHTRARPSENHVGHSNEDSISD